MAAIDEHSRCKGSIPQEQRQSYIDAWEEVIVDTDDPRWISAERTTFRAYHQMEDRACDLVHIAPTTIAGVTALMTYVAVVEKDGDSDLAWPNRLDDEQGDRVLGKRWSYFLHRNLAVSMQSIVNGGRA